METPDFLLSPEVTTKCAVCISSVADDPAESKRMVELNIYFFAPAVQHLTMTPMLTEQRVINSDVGFILYQGQA